MMKYSYRADANPTAMTVRTEDVVLHVYTARSGVQVVSTQAEATDFVTAAHYLVWAWMKQAQRVATRLREGDPA